MDLKTLFHQDKNIEPTQFSKPMVVSDELATLDCEKWTGVGGLERGGSCVSHPILRPTSLIVPSRFDFEMDL